MIDVDAFFDTETHTVTYLVQDAETQTAALIDPVLDYDQNAAALETRSIDAILMSARQRGLDIAWVLDTHAHADHLTAADYVRKKIGAKIGIGAKITEVQRTFRPIFNASDIAGKGSAFDVLFEDGDEIHLGDTKITVLHTPGHTPACVTYLIDDAAFVGDTVFMPDYGTARADFPGGDARTLYRSIQRILSLPKHTRIFVGHDYLPTGRETFAWETSVAEQAKSNIHLVGKNEDTYVEMREARDANLSVPRLILPSLQVNIRAGALPPAEEDGQTYLKLPLNRL